MTSREPEDLLQLAIGREPGPTAIAADVARGQRALVRRRTIRGAGLGLAVAAAVVGVVLAPSLGLGASGDVGPSGLGGHSEYEPHELTDDEVLERCADQISAAYPGQDPATLTVIEGEPNYPEIYLGDTVYLADAADDEFVCRLEGDWVPDPLPDTHDAAPAVDDSAQILLECGSLARIDLSTWQVSSVMRNDVMESLSAVLLSPGGGYYGVCQLDPAPVPDVQTWSTASVSNHESPADIHAVPLRDDQYGGTLDGFFARHTYPGTAAVCETDPTTPGQFEPCEQFTTRLSGVLPIDVAGLTIRLGDGTEIPVQVGDHGTFAWDVTWDADDPPPVVDAFYPDGELIGTYPLYLGAPESEG